MQPHSDDDIYQNSGDSYDTGYYPDTPKEQKEAEAKAAGMKAASYPVLDDVADWFDEQIINLPNINNIQVTSMTVNGVKFSRDVAVQAQVLAFQLLGDLLMDKAREFNDFGKKVK